MKAVGALGKLAITPAYLRQIKGAVIFLHGTCDSGPGLQRWVNEVLQREFNFFNHRILYPTAPLRPYEPLNGQVFQIFHQIPQKLHNKCIAQIACVWFNRLRLSPDVPEDLLSIDKAAWNLEKLIREEVEREGIPFSKVVLGGFSQGGTLALHMAYRLHPEVAGCFALSSFLPPDSGVYERLDKLRPTVDKGTEVDVALDNNGSAQSQSQYSPPNQIPKAVQAPQNLGPSKLKMPGGSGDTELRTADALSPPSSLETSIHKRENQSKLPQLFMSHGTHDPLVLHSWAKSTFSKLRDHGVNGHFYTVPKLEHRIDQQQLQVLHEWIERLLKESSPSTRPSNPTPS